MIEKTKKPYCHRCGEEIAEDAQYCLYFSVPVGVETRSGELKVEEIRGPYPFATLRR